MQLLSQVGYAKHRGVSPQRIAELKKQGRLILNGKKVDVDATDKALDTGLATYRGGQIGGSRSAAARAQDATARTENGNGSAGITGPPEPPPQGMAQSVAMKEFYLSKLREVEYDEKLGTLVDVAAVTEEIAAVFATVRNLFLGLPAKLAPRVIHCKTAEAARLLIQGEVEQILCELSAEPDEDE